MLPVMTTPRDMATLHMIIVQDMEAMITALTTIRVVIIHHPILNLRYQSNLLHSPRFQKIRCQKWQIQVIIQKVVMEEISEIPEVGVVVVEEVLGEVVKVIEVVTKVIEVGVRDTEAVIQALEEVGTPEVLDPGHQSLNPKVLRL